MLEFFWSLFIFPAELKKHFEEYGEVVEAVVMRNLATGVSRFA